MLGEEAAVSASGESGSPQGVTGECSEKWFCECRAGAAPAWAHQGRLQGGGGTWPDLVLAWGSVSERSRAFALLPHGGTLSLLSGPCRLEGGPSLGGGGP